MDGSGNPWPPAPQPKFECVQVQDWRLEPATITAMSVRAHSRRYTGPMSTGNPDVGSGVTLLRGDPYSPCARTCYWRAPGLALTCRELRLQPGLHATWKSASTTRPELISCLKLMLRRSSLARLPGRRRRQHGLGRWDVPSSCSCIYTLGGVISLVPTLPLPDPLLPFLH